MSDLHIQRDHHLGLPRAREVARAWARKAEEKFDMECTYEEGETQDTLTFTRVLDERLAVMDSTAATLCRDNGLPILVFDLGQPANIAKAVKGESVGTLVRE